MYSPIYFLLYYFPSDFFLFFYSFFLLFPYYPYILSMSVPHLGLSNLFLFHVQGFHVVFQLYFFFISLRFHLFLFLFLIFSFYTNLTFVTKDYNHIRTQSKCLAESISKHIYHPADPLLSSFLFIITFFCYCCYSLRCCYTNQESVLAISLIVLLLLL